MAAIDFNGLASVVLAIFAIIGIIAIAIPYYRKNRRDTVVSILNEEIAAMEVRLKRIENENGELQQADKDNKARISFLESTLTDGMAKIVGDKVVTHIEKWKELQRAKG